MINLIITDDHPVFIDGLKTTLAGAQDIHIAGEALNGKQLLELLKTIDADIVLLDINMPEMDGLQTAKAMKQNHKTVKIIMLTQYDEKRFRTKCREMGVEGYILKGSNKDDLVKAITNVYNGGILYEAGKEVQNRFPVPDLMDEIQLTGKEEKVLELIADEKKEDEIANELKISKTTVKEYKRRMLVKTGTKSVVGLIKWAFRKRVIK